MAVVFYGDGEHPSGFIGFHVATSFGAAIEFQQKYFSVDEYGVATGSRMAHELEARWRVEAMLARSGRELPTTGHKPGPGLLAAGLTAMFRVRRAKPPGLATSVDPVFVVQMPGYGRGQRDFSAARLRINGAFSQAVDYFALIHRLSDQEKIILLKLKPKPDLFVHSLRLGLLKRGIIITAARVEGMLQEGKQ